MPKLPALVACPLAFAIATATAPVRAAEAPEPTSTTQTPEVRAAAKAKFDAGLAKYEAGDYDGAIAAWTAAHALMADDSAVREARYVLGFDLAQAHLRAYKMDRDRNHFAPARALLEDYVAWVDRPQYTMDEAEREDRPRAIEMLAFIDHEQAGAAVEPAPVLAPVVVPAKVEVDAPVHRVDAQAQQKRLRRAKGMIAGGGVALGLAIGSGIALGVAATRAPRFERDYERLTSEVAEQGGEPTPEQQDALDRAELGGKRANAGTIAAAAAIVVLVPVGVGLLAGGLVVRKRALRAAPAVGPGYAGASLSLRF
jgi:hypothetical protein